jgi:hypothetical protein
VGEAQSVRVTVQKRKKRERPKLMLP